MKYLDTRTIGRCSSFAPHRSDSRSGGCCCSVVSESPSGSYSTRNAHCSQFDQSSSIPEPLPYQIENSQTFSSVRRHECRVRRSTDNCYVRDYCIGCSCSAKSDTSGYCLTLRRDRVESRAQRAVLDEDTHRRGLLRPLEKSRELLSLFRTRTGSATGLRRNDACSQKTYSLRSSDRISGRSGRSICTVSYRHYIAWTELL